MLPLTKARRSVALTAAAAVALGLAGCGGDAGDDASGGAVWQAPASGAATSRPPTRIKTITSGCDLLSAKVVVDILGSSQGTELQAKDSTDTNGDTTRYNCLYGKDGRDVLSLVATAYPDRADTATETIDAVAEGSNTETTRVDSVGADAVAYTEENVRVLAFVKPYEQELRLVVLSGPALIPQGRYVDLARKVAERL
ncbi:hypothetical protein [Plantactinospora sonchi]|uniref:DUF3558 domain-containing protein n=1 Tax=Plantactinospora sonchi TaxID=1544735 RepID=A0ABU7RKH3_9ACTN